MRVMVVLLFGVSVFSCGGPVEDAVRNWGERERRTRQKDISEEDLEKWRKDFRLSEERTRELYENITEIVQEAGLRGLLARRIAQAYVREGRYEEASGLYRAAIEGRLPEAKEDRKIHYLESALPWFVIALNRHKPEPDLLFEAGLCYANASRALGWEEDRWRVAVLLFETVRRILPGDIRASYELALLYSKVENERLRDQDLALELLDEVLRRDEKDVSARFARAHVLASTGDFEEARGEYGRILEMLADRGMKNTPHYRQAERNMSDLKLCETGSPACPILRR